jgi:hypothetical protein
VVEVEFGNHNLKQLVTKMKTKENSYPPNLAQTFTLQFEISDPKNM